MTSDGPSSELVVIEEIAPSPPPRRSPRRWLLTAGAWACAALAVVGGSIALGWWIATTTVIAGGENPSPEVVEVALPLRLDGEALMPDVRGLDPETALQVIADAGIPVGVVTTQERPAAGLTGVILQQRPVFGTPDPAEILLVISTPAAVPDLAGLSIAEASNRLIELGARVDRFEVFDPEATVGIVTAVDPAPGQALPEVVRLTVTAAPATAFLADLDFRGACSTPNSLTMDGVAYAHGLECSAQTSGRETSWQLGNAAAILRGTLGVPDTEAPGTTVAVRVFGDGVELGSYALAYGETTDIDLRVSGVIRLSIVVTGSSGTAAGFGDLQVLGSRAALTALPRR